MLYKFENGIHEIRKGSLIEILHGEPEAHLMRVDRFEGIFIVTKDLGTSEGRKEDEGEIWHVPSHLEWEWFVKY